MASAQNFARLKERTSSYALAGLALCLLPSVLIGSVEAISNPEQPAALVQVTVCAALAVASTALGFTSFRARPAFLCACLILVGLGAFYLYGNTPAGTAFVLIGGVVTTFYFGARRGLEVLAAALFGTAWIVHMHVHGQTVSGSPAATMPTIPADWLATLAVFVVCGFWLVWATARMTRQLHRVLMPSERPELSWRHAAGEISTFDIWGEIDQPIMILDLKMRIIDCNPAAARLVEASCPADLIGRDAYDYVHPGAPYQAPLKWDGAEAMDGEGHTTTTTLVTRSGRKVMVESKLHGLRDNDGNVTNIFLMARDITAHSALERERNLNKLLWSQSAVAIATFDRETRFISASPGLEQMLGYSEAELRGRFARDISNGADSVDERLAFPERVSTRYPDRPTELVQKNGAVISCFTRIYPLSDPLNPEVAYVGIGLNVSEQQSLRARTAMFDAVWNQLRECVAIVDPDDIVVYCNKAYAGIYHLTPDDVIGRPVTAVPGARKVKQYAARIERARAGEHFSEVVPVSETTGGSGWMLASYSPLPDDGSGNVIVIIIDVTELRTAELARQSTEAQYEQLLSSVLDAVISTDQDGFIVAANPAAEKLFEYSRAELVGQPLTMLLPERSRKGHQHLMQGYARSGAAGRGMANFREVQGVAKSGRDVYLEIAIAQIGAGAAKRLTAVIRDVTEQRQLESRVRHIDKMRAIGQLAAGIAHDFNNIMAVVSGSAEIGLEGLKEKDPSRRLFDRILSSSQMGKDLTGSLLAFARGELQQLTAVEVDDLLDTMMSLLGRTFGANITLDCDVDPGCWPIMADRSQIQNVLLNMAINARDAMPKGGQLLLTAQNSPGYLLVDQSGQTRKVDMVEIDVTDTGTGMTEEVRQRALEPFFTTKGAGKGTGLGLATAFGVVQRSGGAMEIHSEAGHGTTIKVFLPRADVIERAVDVAPRQTDSLAGHTILLVEDNAPLRETLREQLSSVGFVVHDAATSTDARALFRNVNDIDVLVSDYRLAEDATGLDLAFEFREARPDMSIIIMTGYLELAAARNAPSDVVMLTKPVPIQELIGHIRGVGAPKGASIH